jgi:hypothetical protein
VILFHHGPRRSSPRRLWPRRFASLSAPSPHAGNLKCRRGPTGQQRVFARFAQSSRAWLGLPHCRRSPLDGTVRHRKRPYLRVRRDADGHILLRLATLRERFASLDYGLAAAASQTSYEIRAEISTITRLISPSPCDATAIDYSRRRRAVYSP